ncbi:MAG: D-cysteine desulfhydrase family protein [bacterium]
MQILDHPVLRTIRGWPRVALGTWPTPLHFAERLSAHLGTSLFLKREDYGPIGLWGNKARKLELVLGRARADGADTLITTGAIESNHCRLTAATAAKLGLTCHLVLRGSPPQVPGGNLLLDRLFGACVTIAPDEPSAEAAIEEIASRLRLAGHRPFVIPVGGTIVESTGAFIECGAEIAQQSASIGGPPGAIVVTVGSATTFAGLWIGTRLLLPDTRVIGITIGKTRTEAMDRIHLILKDVGQVLPLPMLDQPEIVDRYVGEGYGIPSQAGIEALKLTAQLEGVVLDTTYTAKAFAGLLGEVRSGVLAQERRLVFVHTGGVPDVFTKGAYLWTQGTS